MCDCEQGVFTGVWARHLAIRWRWWRSMQVRVLQTDFQWPIHWRLPSLGGGWWKVWRRVYLYQARGQQGLLYVRARACAVCEACGMSVPTAVQLCKPES